MPDAREIADSLAARGIKLRLGEQVYDPTDPMGKMFFNILATFAEFEVDILRMRVNAGIAAAKASGTRFGRPPVEPETIAEKLKIATDARTKGRTATQAAFLVGWSRATFYRHQQAYAGNESAD